MQKRRTFLGVGLAGLALPAWAQSSGGDADGLNDRGAPTGRTGAATRGGGGDAALDLAAPLRGVGLSATDRPTLYYFLTGFGIGAATLKD